MYISGTSFTNFEIYEQPIADFTIFGACKLHGWNVRRKFGMVLSGKYFAPFDLYLTLIVVINCRQIWLEVVHWRSPPALNNNESIEVRRFPKAKLHFNFILDKAEIWSNQSEIDTYYWLLLHATALVLQKSIYCHQGSWAPVVKRKFLNDWSETLKYE